MSTFRTILTAIGQALQVDALRFSGAVSPGNTLVADADGNFVPAAGGGTGTGVAWPAGTSWAEVYEAASAARPCVVRIPYDGETRTITAGTYDLTGIDFEGSALLNNIRSIVDVDEGAHLGTVLRLTRVHFKFHNTASPSFDQSYPIDITLNDAAIGNEGSFAALVPPASGGPGTPACVVRLFNRSTLFAATHAFAALPVNGRARFEIIGGSLVESGAVTAADVSAQATVVRDSTSGWTRGATGGTDIELPLPPMFDAVLAALGLDLTFSLDEVDAFKIWQSGQIATGDATGASDFGIPVLLLGTGGAIAYWNGGSPLLALEYDSGAARFNFGDGSKPTLYRGAVNRDASSQSGNFTVTNSNSVYELTGTGQTVTLNNAFAVGTEILLVSTTAAAAPGHTIAVNGGGVIGRSNVAFAASMPWPNNTTAIRVRKVGSGNWVAMLMT
jgi:hypothetical protein